MGRPSSSKSLTPKRDTLENVLICLRSNLYTDDNPSLPVTLMGSRPTGVTILATIQILAGLLYLIAGAGIVLLGGVIGDIYAGIGGIIGALAALWFSPTVRVAQELALFISEARRGGPAAVRLVRAFEAWAQAHGAKHVTLSCITAVRGEAVGNLFARLGFTERERAHVKEV